MRSLAKLAFGSLLGISLVLTGSTQAKADNCLLIVCVDAPVLGPVVGTIGDVLEEVLTPSNPAPPVPPVKPPVQPPVNPPVQPPTQPGTPTTPQQPTTPGTTTPGTTPSESGNSDEVIGITDGEVTPVPTMSPLPSPTPSPTKTYTPPRLLPDDEDDAVVETFEHVSVLLPYIVGVIFMLLVVLSITSGLKYLQSRRKVGIHDTSALPLKK